MTLHSTTIPSLLMMGPLALALGFIGLQSCQSQEHCQHIDTQFEHVAQRQHETNVRLGEIEKTLSALPTAAPNDGKAPPTRQKQGDRPSETLIYKVPVGDAHVQGNPEALVTIVEWSDFQCPYCSRVTPTIEQLLEDYGDDIRVAFKHNPLAFHPRAKPAALAAEAAGRQGKFWEMHDKLFEHQKQLTDENFLVWADELSLDIAQFEKDLKDPALGKKAMAHQTQGMALGARGTPAFFINGRFLSGAQPLANFKKLIDQEIKKANKLVTAGTPRAEVYDAIIEKGRTEV